MNARLASGMSETFWEIWTSGLPKRDRYGKGFAQVCVEVLDQRSPSTQDEFRDPRRLLLALVVVE